MQLGNSEVIDWPLLEQYQDILGTQGISESITMFNNVVPEYFQEFTALYSQRNEEQLRSQAHKLKGSCRSLGFKRLGDMMETMEKADWEWHDVKLVIAEWPQCFTADTATIKEWVLKLDQ